MQVYILNKAVKVFNDLLNLTLNHKRRATYYNHILSVYNNKGEDTKVVPFYKHLLKIYKLTLGDGHPETKSMVKNIESIKKNL
jgi:hypothetical protein